MMKWIVGLSLLFSNVASLAATSVDWLQVKSEDGITIYSRHHSDGLAQIRAQMFVPTSYFAFMRLLDDSEHVPNWIDNVSNSRVLQKISDTENIVYTQFSAPWPAKNRDMVTYSKFEMLPNGLSLDIVDALNYLPEQPGYIRITQVNAHWTLQKLTNGMTHIDYIAFANPGGALPNWLVNKLSTDSAFTTFKGLRRELATYQDKLHPAVNE